MPPICELVMEMPHYAIWLIAPCRDGAENYEDTGAQVIL